MHRIIWTGVVEAIALLMAAAVGAWLQARLTRRVSVELHRTERRQNALLELLDFLSSIQLATEKCLDHHDVWVGTAGGVPGPMVRRFPDLDTWEMAAEPDAELMKWGDIVGRVHTAESAWRERLRARIADPSLDQPWGEISRLGFSLATGHGGRPREAAERIKALVPPVMDRIRAMA